MAKFLASCQKPIAFRLALFSLFVFSLWLRQAFPISAIGQAVHDDLLFVRFAASIGQGDWLGAYGNMTHAKGVLYSIFLLLNHATGLPLKITEHLVYLLSALYFSSTLGTCFRSRWVVLLTFGLLAFIPSAWAPLLGGRVVREGLYVSLTLLLLALALRCFVLPAEGSHSMRAEIGAKWRSLVLLGLMAGMFWLTREEGVWLVPAVGICFVYWLGRNLPPLNALGFPTGRLLVITIALPLIPFLLVVGTINAINFHWYGVFRNNDFRSADFQAAYGAISRIKPQSWQRYVVFPRDAREKAYLFSAAARELQPYLEGDGGEMWRKIGCTQTGMSPCPEILSGWFVWALRDAVAAAGHYRSATDAQAFYLRLAREINEGCERNPEACFAPRQSLLPPWRGHFVADTLVASWHVLSTLATFRGLGVGILPSGGSDRQLALFELVTNGPLASREGPTGEGYQGYVVSDGSYTLAIDHNTARLGAQLTTGSGSEAAGAAVGEARTVRFFLNARCEPLPCELRIDRLEQPPVSIRLDPSIPPGLLYENSGVRVVFQGRRPAATQLAVPVVSPRDYVRKEIAQAIAVQEARVAAAGIPISLIVWLSAVVVSVRRRAIHPGSIALTVLLAAVSTRVTLLGFLEATSIPSNNMLYLSPVAPLTLALVPCALALVIAMARSGTRSQPPLGSELE